MKKTMYTSTCVRHLDGFRTGLSVFGLKLFSRRKFVSTEKKGHIISCQSSKHFTSFSKSILAAMFEQDILVNQYVTPVFKLSTGIKYRCHRGENLAPTPVIQYPVKYDDTIFPARHLTGGDWLNRQDRSAIWGALSWIILWRR